MTSLDYELEIQTFHGGNRVLDSAFTTIAVHFHLYIHRLHDFTFPPISGDAEVVGDILRKRIKSTHVYYSHQDDVADIYERSEMHILWTRLDHIYSK